jgi:hypothetical protein
MRFSQWMVLREETSIDAQDILYTACVLHRNSQHYLVNLVDKWMFEHTGSGISRQGWIIRTHHMTIKFKPKQADLEAITPLLGEEVELIVTDIAYDDYGIAVKVYPKKALPIGQIPHITIAHSHDVSPVYSNALMADKTKWKSVNEPVTVVSYLVGVSGDRVYPDLGSLLLATQTV